MSTSVIERPLKDKEFSFPNEHSFQSKAQSWAEWAALMLSAALALGTTVFRGGNRHVPLIAIEWLALLVLLALSVQILAAGRQPETLGSKGLSRWGLLLLAGAPVWVVLLQVTLLPALGVDATAPLASWHTCLVGLTMSALLLMGLTAIPAHINRLLKVWIGVAVAQALVGMMQLGGAEVLRFDAVSGEPAIGTFASKNTYSNFLVMAIPLVTNKLLGRSSSSSANGGSEGKPWIWGLALLTLLVALIASTSRTGIATGLLVALLAVALLQPASNHSESKTTARRGYRFALLGGAVALGLLALMAGGLDWVDRFEGERLVADAALRASMREATWQGALAYWPWGSGLGSYTVAFPRFQPPELGRYLIDPAHSEYLQALMEMGAAFVMIAAATLGLIGRRVWLLVHSARVGQPRASRGKQSSRSVSRAGWSSQDRLAIACGLGVLATALHAWVDYPFRVPANAMFAAFLLGVFLREPASKVDSSRLCEIP